MKKLVGITVMLLLSCLLASLSVAQKPGEKSAVESMVETERAFAKMSEEQGIRPAFMSFIADDGILFRPGAVKGKRWMTEHPLPPSDKRPLLSWYPSIAGVSAAGDMGYSTGPWEFKNDSHDASPSGWGNFLTIWKKQADGTWKFAVDLGISYPQPAHAAAPWQPSDQQMKAGGVGPKGDKKSQVVALLRREKEFSDAVGKMGAQKAFAAFAHRDVLMYRDGKQPLGKDEAESLLAGPIRWNWDPTFADVSLSDDLGYSYGTYNFETKEANQSAVESGNYFRIWKRDGSQWKILFDLTNPVAPQKKD